MYGPKVEDMPGPTAEAREIQFRQWAKRDSMYELWGQNQEPAPAAVAAKVEYDATVTELCELLGPNAHCAQVDSDLFSMFSDAHKDVYNFRPRHHVTLLEVRQWLDELPALIERLGDTYA
jgi:hypothetical protein